MDECFSPARIIDGGHVVLPTFPVRIVIVFYLLGRFIYPGIFYAGSVEKNEQGKIDSIFYGSCITDAMEKKEDYKNEWKL